MKQRMVVVTMKMLLSAWRPMIARLIRGLNDWSLYSVHRNDVLTKQMHGLYTILNAYCN